MRSYAAKSFKGIQVTGVAHERSYVTHAPICRIFLQLSEPPPLGWSYLYCKVWGTVNYESKAAMGAEQNCLWIECVPDDLNHLHLPWVNEALKEANAQFRQSQLQKTVALRKEAQQNAQSQAALNQLATNMTTAAPQEPAGRRHGFENILATLKSTFTPGKRKLPQ